MHCSIKTAVIVCAFSLATSAFASKNVLPDSCGADQVKFDVDLKKDQPAPAPAEAGKAQFVFIETMNRPSKTAAILGGISVPDMTARFGLDGTWVGAGKANSYFTLSVPPGDHHLCTSVKGEKDSVGMLTVAAEPGKTYYIEYKILPNITRVHGNNGSSGIGMMPTATFLVLSEDEGKFRVKASAVSNFKAKD